jgi:hypothetical protein
MKNHEAGEFELVLGTGQLLSLDRQRRASP